MSSGNIIVKAEGFARKEYSKNEASHQWSHIEAVMKRALEIASNFKDVDYEALRLAVILHDIDYKDYESHVEASIRVAERFLKENNYPGDRIKKVLEIMLNHSGPHRRRLGDARLLEGKIIYDADKSIMIKDAASYEKYFPTLYLEETRGLVKKLFF